MKAITLKIEDEVFRKIKAEMTLRMMLGKTGGAVDSFMIKLINVIDENQTEYHFKFKGKEKGN